MFLLNFWPPLEHTQGRLLQSSCIVHAAKNPKSLFFLCQNPILSHTTHCAFTMTSSEPSTLEASQFQGP